MIPSEVEQVLEPKVFVIVDLCVAGVDTKIVVLQTGVLHDHLVLSNEQTSSQEVPHRLMQSRMEPFPGVCVPDRL